MTGGRVDKRNQRRWEEGELESNLTTFRHVLLAEILIFWFRLSQGQRRLS